jgi:hypothetical protein
VVVQSVGVGTCAEGHERVRHHIFRAVVREHRLVAEDFTLDEVCGGRVGRGGETTNSHHDFNQPLHYTSSSTGSLLCVRDLLGGGLLRDEGVLPQSCFVAQLGRRLSRFLALPIHGERIGSSPLVNWLLENQGFPFWVVMRGREVDALPFSGRLVVVSGRDPFWVSRG